MIPLELPKPELTNIKRHNGIAGQYSVSVNVRYPGEPLETLVFYGSTYGGKIIMKTPYQELFVDRAATDRLGDTLDEDWVRRFFE